MKTIKKENIHIKVTKQEKITIQKLAKAQGRNMSNYILWLVAQDSINKNE